MACILESNIKEMNPSKKLPGRTDEFYFQSFDYILQESDDDFKKAFFGEGKILGVFFISDALGDEYYNLEGVSERRHKVAEELSQKYIK